MTSLIKRTAIFLQPFELPDFKETLPAGEYDIEIRLPESADRPGVKLTSTVLIRLPQRSAHPGLVRTLTIPLAALEQAIAKDKLTGRLLVDFVLEEMLGDPMIRLIMLADGVTEYEMRKLYASRTCDPAT